MPILEERLPAGLAACRALVLIGAMASGSGVAAAERSPARGDAPALTDVRAMGKFLDVVPGSPGMEAWTPFLAALSVNDAVARNLDDAVIATARVDRRTAHGSFNTTVIKVVTEGLRRVSDEDLLAARPLIAKFVGGPSPCVDESTQAPALQGPLMIADEPKGLEPVLTRAVEAINLRRPCAR